MRKSKPRKQWALVNPITHATFQASRLTVGEWNTQLTPVIAALEAIQRGEWAVRANWTPLFYCLNRIESILTLKKVDDQGLIDECQAVFVDALERKEETGATALKAKELETLRWMVTVYGDLLREISHGDFSRACNHTDANMQRIVKSPPTHNTRRIGGMVIELEKFK